MSMDFFTVEYNSLPFIPLFDGPKATSSAANGSNKAASLSCKESTGLDDARIFPLVKLFNPARHSNKVDFPQPDGPVIETRVPFFSSNETCQEKR